jgi:hypothetical protein
MEAGTYNKTFERSLKAEPLADRGEHWHLCV